MRPPSHALPMRTAVAMQLDPCQMAYAAGFKQLDPWQQALLRSTNSRIILNCSRQVGKSTTNGIIAAHQSVFHPGSLTIMVSPTQRQSGELFKKCMSVYKALGAPVPLVSDSASSAEFANGSRIVSLPGNEATVRGFSGPNLVLADEASRIPSELFMAVTPMLAVSQGRLIVLSTPFGTRGFFYETWIAGCGNGWHNWLHSPQRGVYHEVGSDGWERIAVPATSVERIPPEFLVEQRRVMGEWWFRQEFMCEFLEAMTATFTRSEVDAAFTEEVEAWF